MSGICQLRTFSSFLQHSASVSLIHEVVVTEASTPTDQSNTYEALWSVSCSQGALPVNESGPQMKVLGAWDVGMNSEQLQILSRCCSSSFEHFLSLLGPLGTCACLVVVWCRCTCLQGDSSSPGLLFPAGPIVPLWLWLELRVYLSFP